MRLDRLLSITIMLINRRRVTAPELSDHFGVSVRTIYRDIEAIQAAGIPVVSYQGHEGGYHIMDNYRISRQVLTFDDIVSILTTLKGINATLDSKDLGEVIEKIGCLIPEEREEEFIRRSEQIAFDIVPWGYGQRQQEHFSLLYRGITECRTVSFSYTTYQSVATGRIVEPMTLLFKSYCWYLFGYCRLRHDYRLFKLSRMRNLALQDDVFSRRDKSYRDMPEANDHASARTTIPLELRFVPRARVKAEDFFEPAHISIDPDGSPVVRVELPDDDWIYSWLLSFGDEVEVTGPPHVRTRFSEYLKKIQKNYAT